MTAWLSVDMRWVIALVAGVVLTISSCTGGSVDEEPLAVDLTNGESVFATSCAACHGPRGDGTGLGPPLVDTIYRSGHHPDAAFEVAIRLGSPQHHWDFGTMPAVPALSSQDILDVTAFVRELQRQAGID